MKFKDVKEKCLQLLKLNNTPEGIALGVSIGVFIGISPLYGLHTILVLLAAVLIPRTNKIAILLGTNISIPPTLPFITWSGYEIGRWILHKDYPPLSWAYFKQITFQSVSRLYVPLLVGSLVLGIVCSAVFYFVTLTVLRRAQRNKIGAG